jgi:hypothetical protein
MSLCHKYEKWFSDYLEHDLDQRRNDELQAHLQLCSSCRLRLRNLSSLHASLHNLKTVKTSPEFTFLLHARIRRQGKKRWAGAFAWTLFDLNWRLPAYGAATLFLLFLGAQMQQFADSRKSSSATSILALADQEPVDSGYLVVTTVDSVNQNVQILNTGSVANHSSSPTFFVSDKQFETLRRADLPNLRTAPTREPSIYLTPNTPGIQKANLEYSF